jgi:hypothetical protein
MSATTMPETNGVATPATETASAPRNRVKAALTGTAFGRLYALAGKCNAKRFTLRRKFEEGSVSLRLDGYPSSLTATAVAKLAESGGTVTGRVTVGAATGSFSAVAIGATASAMVTEMTDAD